MVRLRLKAGVTTTRHCHSGLDPESRDAKKRTTALRAAVLISVSITSLLHETRACMWFAFVGDELHSVAAAFEFADR